MVSSNCANCKKLRPAFCYQEPRAVFFVNMCVVCLQDGIFHQPEKMLWHDAQLGLFSFSLLMSKRTCSNAMPFASFLQCFLVLPRSDEEQEDPHLARGFAFAWWKDGPTSCWAAPLARTTSHWKRIKNGIFSINLNSEMFLQTAMVPWCFIAIKLVLHFTVVFPNPIGETQADFTCSGLAYWFLHLRWSWGPWFFGWFGSKSYNKNIQKYQMGTVSSEFLKKGSNVDELWRQLIWSPVFEAVFLLHRHKSQSGFVVSHAASFVWIRSDIQPTWDEHRWRWCFANEFPKESLSGNINISSSLGPAAKQHPVSHAFGPRFTLLRDWRPVPASVSHVIGRRDEHVPLLSCIIRHLFLRVNWSV